MADVLEQDQTHQRLQEVNTALENGMFVHVRRLLQEMEPEDIAHLLEASPPKERQVLWQLTDPEEQGETLDELSEDVKECVETARLTKKVNEKRATQRYQPNKKPYHFLGLRGSTPRRGGGSRGAKLR